jgi:hypothetical protein
MLNVLIKLNEPLGTSLGPNFDLVSNVGSVTPSTATRTQLLTGINVAVDQTATQVSIYSEGTCTNGITVNISDLPVIDYTTSCNCGDAQVPRVNFVLTNFSGGEGNIYYYSRFWYYTEAEAEANSQYVGPVTGLLGVAYGSNITYNCPVTVWVGIQDVYGNKKIKSITNTCPPPPPPTTTQYVPFTTTTTTTPNPSNPYKSYRVNNYICNQNCIPTLYNQTITVPQAGVVQIGKYYLSATNPNISYLILEQIGWGGNSGNDITNFTAYDYCYQACGLTPTTSTTTTVLSAPTNTVFAKYDVVPGPTQDVVKTVFVKYDVQ